MTKTLPRGQFCIDFELRKKSVTNHKIFYWDKLYFNVQFRSQTLIDLIIIDYAIETHSYTLLRRFGIERIVESVDFCKGQIKLQNNAKKINEVENTKFNCCNVHERLRLFFLSALPSVSLSNVIQSEIN